MDSNSVNVLPASAPPVQRRPWWRRLLSRARRKAERVLHSGRRRRAQERVGALAGARSVLFLCEGNIYRSPFAAACFAAITRERGLSELAVSSAGFVGPGRPSPEDALLLAERFAIDLTTHRSRLINGAMIGENDLIVVMEARQARELRTRFGAAPGKLLVLGDLDPEPIDRRSIADPWRAPVAVLESSYARVERCVSALADLAHSWGMRA